MDSIIRQTVKTLDAMFGRFIILNPNRDSHKEHQISASETFSIQAPLPYLNDFLDYIKKTREGLIIEDTHRDLRWPKFPGETFRSVIIAPLFGRLDLIGALMLVHGQAGYFNLEHQRLLQAIANQAAIAVENIQLYERIKSLSK
jgi:GAF domain-containing protein